MTLTLACTSVTPAPELGAELTLDGFGLRLTPPTAWVQTARADGAVILGPAERLREPSWISVGPRTEAAVEATGWVAPLEEQVLRPDPQAEREVTRLTGTFADGHGRYPVQADVARRAELPAVRASLGSLKAP